MKKRVACYFVVFCAITIGYLSKRSTADLDATPRITVTYNELSDAKWFSDNVKNYSTLLLEDENGILYVGARGAIFSLNSSDISQRSRRTIHWEVNADETKVCQEKGRNNQTECFNHIRLLQRFNETHLYVCGTHAFSPLCCYIEIITSWITVHVSTCPTTSPPLISSSLLIDNVHGELWYGRRKLSQFCYI